MMSQTDGHRDQSLTSVDFGVGRQMFSATKLTAKSNAGLVSEVMRTLLAPILLTHSPPKVGNSM